jgi:hypothetical protein
MKTLHIKTIQLSEKILIMLSLIFVSGCSESFLKPDPLSFYEPTKTFTSREGLESALGFCDRHLRTYWSYWQTADLSLPISSDYMFSDMAVAGKTDDSNIFIDIATRLTPNGLEDNTTNRLLYFWDETYNGIKYANTVTTFLDKVEGLDTDLRNEFMGKAYFHRAFRYLALCFEFKNVPLITKIVELPKFDYRSTKREAILQMITADMEKAVEWVPDQSKMSMKGSINKAACRQLLIKCYLATGQWDKALEQADILIDRSGYSLMENNFGTFINPFPETWPVTRNVIWDLHRPENKLIAANKEVILGMVNRAGTNTEIKLRSMRNLLPFLDADAIIGPDAKRAFRIYPENASTYDAKYNYNRALGRGIAHIRPTRFATHDVWVVNGAPDKGDLRHSGATGNWVYMDSLRYNNREHNEWYGEKVSLYADNGDLLCSDTVRSWFDWPHYKYFYEDPTELGGSQTNHRGGSGDQYIYRLAETYLLRAEIKFYKGDIAGATADVNKVRQRAKCEQLYSSVTIDDIVNERARELNMEEWRFMELSRISYCLALSGKPDETGATYSVDNLHENSFWWHRISKYNNYYNKPGAPLIKSRNFTMAANNLYWPIPRKAIDANRNGKLRQNEGYDGFDPGVPMWETWQEAVADEDKIN